MKILYFGDLIGKAGIRGLSLYLKKHIEEKKPDFIFVNGENLAGGKGITKEVFNEVRDLGVDGFSTGNHVFDKREIIALLRETGEVIRPLNYPVGIPGKGYQIFKKNNLKVAVINLCGRVFMKPLDCPFKRVESAIKTIREETDIILVDFHAEATAEKQALGHFLDGQVAGVFGTHTHTQTNDLQLLKKGTLYLTDLGMVGANDSILGSKKDTIINHFLTGMPFRVEVEVSGPIRINGVELEIDTDGSINSFQLINELI